MQNKRNKIVKSIFSKELAYVHNINQVINLGLRNNDFNLNHKNNLLFKSQSFVFSNSTLF